MQLEDCISKDEITEMTWYLHWVLMRSKLCGSDGQVGDWSTYCKHCMMYVQLTELQDGLVMNSSTYCQPVAFSNH